MRRWVGSALPLLLSILTACSKDTPCTNCDTLVIVATSEPSSVFPPLVFETVGRDISDQVFERLADLKAGKATVDSTAYEPRLAASWERVDSLTLRFHLRPGARWQNGAPVTAQDVVFSFDAAVDPDLETAAGEQLRNSLHAAAEDSATVLVRFGRYYPEQLYDATWHVRIIPEKVFASIPRKEWEKDTALSHLIGSGPYRFESWERGQFITLTADSNHTPRAAIRRIIWRFAPDPDAALNAVLGHEADLMESVGSPERVARVEGDSTLSAIRYPSAAYGFVGYQISAKGRRPILAERAIRRALNLAADRATIAQAVFGPDTKAPPGPMSQLLWIWDDGIQTLPYDTAAAARELDAAGWVRGKDWIRQKNGRALSLEILVPSSSVARKSAAEALQEAWRKIGVAASVVAVEFPVFQERLGRGQFDAYVGAYLDEPSPRGLADQWTSRGIGALNYGGYRSAAFDDLFARAEAARGVVEAQPLWREAMDTINADAPALFLYAPTVVAAVSRRLEGVTIDPYAWVSELPGFRITH